MRPMILSRIPRVRLVDDQHPLGVQEAERQRAGGLGQAGGTLLEKVDRNAASSAHAAPEDPA
jgi:hypothetical protein